MPPFVQSKATCSLVFRPSTVFQGCGPSSPPFLSLGFCSEPDGGIPGWIFLGETGGSVRFALSSRASTSIDDWPVYKWFGNDTISIVPLTMGTNIIFTSSLDVAKQVIAGGSKSVWHKADEYGEGLLQVVPAGRREEAQLLCSIFGHNVASTDGDTWRRHRRITNPAFNPSTCTPC
jgi:hypothetical protein